MVFLNANGSDFQFLILNHTLCSSVLQGTTRSSIAHTRNLAVPLIFPRLQRPVCFPSRTDLESLTSYLRGSNHTQSTVLSSLIWTHKITGNQLLDCPCLSRHTIAAALLTDPASLMRVTFHQCSRDKSLPSSVVLCSRASLRFLCLQQRLFLHSSQRS